MTIDIHDVEWITNEYGIQVIYAGSSYSPTYMVVKKLDDEIGYIYGNMGR